MPEALCAFFPAPTLQTCIVHPVRNCPDYASWKDRWLLAAASRSTYTTANAKAVSAELDAFKQGPPGKKFSTVVATWRRVWDRVVGQEIPRFKAVTWGEAEIELRQLHLGEKP